MLSGHGEATRTLIIREVGAASPIHGMVRRACAAYDPRAMRSITPREADVLRLIARGHTYAGAAQRLGVSPHTVATHVKKAYRKLGVHSAGAAVMRAVKLGVLD